MQRLISLLVASRKRTITTFAITLLLLLAVTTTIFAAWLTINTDDHQVDANWSSATQKYTSTCSDSAVDDKYEIAEAHLTNDGSNLYFRLDNCAVFATGNNNLRIVSAIDCNNDGDTDDGMVGGDGTTGDRRIVYAPATDVVQVYDGQNTALIGYSGEQWMGEQINDATAGRSIFEWQMPLKHLYPACRGSMESVGIAFATAEIVLFNPVERDSTDELYAWANPMDFGDAPNDFDFNNDICTRYNSLFPCDGPRHGLGDGLKLGNEVDADGGGLQDEPARKDDTDNVADEDGVEPSYGVVWSAGGSGSLDVTVSGGSGVLNCWIDWNNDEDFADTGEHVIAESAVTAGDHTISLAVPAGVDFTTSPFYTRCRLAPNTGEGNVTTGAVWDGEVEDHLWLPQAATIDIALSGSDAVISWSHLAQNESYQTYRSTSPYFRLADASALTPIVSATPWQYADSGVAGDATPSVYFYVVVGHKDVAGTIIESTPSDEVGLFEFSLTPGSA